MDQRRAAAVDAVAAAVDEAVLPVVPAAEEAVAAHVDVAVPVAEEEAVDAVARQEAANRTTVPALASNLEFFVIKFIFSLIFLCMYEPRMYMHARVHDFLFLREERDEFRYDLCSCFSF